MQSLTKLVWYLLCLYINLVEIQSFHIQLLNTCSRPDILPMGNQHWPSRWQTESILSASEHNDWYPPHPVSEQKGKKKQVLTHYLKQTDVCVYKDRKSFFLGFYLARLHSWIFSNDSCAWAGCIKQHSIKATHDLKAEFQQVKTLELYKA